MRFSRRDFLAASLATPALLTAAAKDDRWTQIERYFRPPAELADKFGDYRPVLEFYDGRKVADASQWPARRKEILDKWHSICGPWPELLKAPKLTIESSEKRENFTQNKVRVETAPGQLQAGYLLVPERGGKRPGVVVPFYEPETSVGLKGQNRDFAYQLAKRGFVALAIGSPGGDARKPDRAGAVCQPLSFLGYVAANAHTVLAQRPEVDAKRIGVVGHSYGGKWALFGSCLYEPFAAAAWSDPGIVWDEKRSNVNYWEKWYLGLEPGKDRKPGLVTAENPRTGAYKTLVEQRHDLHELHALMAPRPFLVSGGAEDPVERWIPLNQSVAVNKLLGQTNRVAMTNRPKHDPSEESNGVMWAFFEHFLTPDA
jgi:hypothetical protein